MMRILCFNQYFSTPDVAGGSRGYEFARRLVAKGHHVTVITTPAFLPREFTGSNYVVRRTVDRVDLVVLQVPYSGQMGFAARMKAFVAFAVGAAWEARRHKADVLFATSTPLTIAIPAIITKLLKRRPLVFEVRDLWPDVPIAMGVLRNGVAIAAARVLEYAAYKAAARVIALSPGMAAGVQRRGIPAERVSVIPNACDTDTFNIHPSAGVALRARLGIPLDHPVVAYTGAFGRVNGVGYLLDVATAMRPLAPNVKFLLVGGGPEYGECRDRAIQRDLLGKNVWMMEAIPKAEIPSVVAAATAMTSVVIPVKELWNNSANKFFDGLAGGKPVILNYGGWQAKLLREIGAGIDVPAGDPSTAARLVAEFLHDRERLRRAAVAAQRLADGVLNRDVLATQFEHVLCAAAKEFRDDIKLPAQLLASTDGPEALRFNAEGSAVRRRPNFVLSQETLEQGRGDCSF
jgi:glycosyltransferase involved in cell wall biosynthesis